MNRLTLRLPPDFARREREIGRAVAIALEGADMTAAGHFPALSVSVPGIAPSLGSRAIGDRAVAAVTQNLAAARPGDRAS